MKQKIFTLSLNPAKIWSGYLSKLVALVLLIGGLGATQQAWGQAATITDDVVSLTLRPTSQAAQSKNFTGSDNNGLYTSPTPLGQSSDNTISVPQLGTYDLNNNSALIISAASLQGILGSSSTNVSATRLQYRVYLASTTDALKPGYTNLALTSTQNGNSSGSVFNGNTTANVNLITGLTSGGTYILDVRFQVDVSRNGSTPRTFSDLSNGDYFLANFYITPPNTTPPGGTTTWQGVARGTSNGSTPTALPSDQDWLNPANWTNGVPTYQSDAIIPEKSNTQIVYPVLNSATATYEVRNLTLQGAQSETASKVTIGIATLNLYGNFSQETDPGLVGNTTGNSGVTDNSQNSTLILAGTNQTISGSILISDLIIAGSGTKSVLVTPIAVSNILSFQPTSVAAGVIIQSALQRTTSGPVETVFSTNGRSYVQFLSTGKISNVFGQAETTVSYIKGVSRADRSLDSRNGRQSNFGNIGLDVKVDHDINNLIVYRIVGSALLGPAGNNTAMPTKRQYQLTGDDNSNSAATAGSTIDVVFHYLDSGSNTNANELNGIDENNLALFRTVDNGPPYQSLGGTVNTTDNTVTRTGIPSLYDYKLVLGDKTNPLPVSLVAFAAVRSNSNALLTWKTASELNNKGFNVQVSADGVSYRTLAFVASKLVNSSSELSYSYTDTENGKASTRYYRLEQVDLDGTLSYSPVRAVNFNGAAATSLALVAYPNPFSSTLGLNVEGATASTTEGTAYVKLVDMTGRTVRDQKVSLAGASLSLGDLSELRSGLYLAKVTLPDGTMQVVRVQKQ